MKQLLNTITMAACFTVVCTAAKAQAATKTSAAEVAPAAVTAKLLKPAAPQQPASITTAEAVLPAGRPIETFKDRIIVPATEQPANAPTAAAKQTTGTVPVQTPGVKE